MGWPPRWLGERYARLYFEFGEEPFTFGAALDLLQDRQGVLLNVLSQLRRCSFLCVFRTEGRNRWYRLFPPDLALLVPQLGVKNLGALKQGIYVHLVLKVAFELHNSYGDRLLSLVLFGSLARGSASPQSDVDLLTVIEGLEGSIASRIGELLEIEQRERIRDELKWLSRRGILTHVSFNPFAPDEMRHFRMFFLDLVQDGITILDRGSFFESLREKFKSLLRSMHAERRFLGEEEWYWVMDPEAELEAMDA